ncbi:hypothetical protein O0I10_005183 [Lichtheimia ornata]|uniref:Rhodanese domain-containing protein n=1 Tax=Lichtheimia ornata TaxID=688661 RepID=A0AAD7V580_9FUNG|nr:uncharacterized protein O0I10_005183 [Lichtheimia ornata]KAJ8659144.1 hypothetical protein O0I10_005183 [Lichtheimia ornata]
MNRQLASRILLQSSWQGALRRSFALSSSCRRFCTNVENHQRHSSTHHPNNKSHPISSSSPITSAATRYRPVSFYRLTPLSKERVEQLRKQIFDQLTTWGVVGRIYLAPEQGISGINCQIAAPIHMLPMVRQFFDGLDMGQIEYTEGLEDLDTPCFRKLRVMIKKNLVAIKDVLPANEIEIQKEQHLDPEEWHRQLSEKGSDAILVDMRNHYEYDIGRFDHAIKMDVDTFREGLDELERMMLARPDKEVYMYCTGGIRCTATSSYFANKGIGKNLKMLKGGITAYGQYIRQNPKEQSLFRGKNFTFDDRRGERVTHDVLARCFQCGAPCDVLHNCANTQCHLLFVQCDVCRTRMNKTCSDLCRQVLEGKRTWNMEYDYHRQIRPSLLCNE